ncbi:MAG TPA: hypothetical protein DD434_05240 [Bacteroidales bacterium]|nr:hypothetical protein [Bacteroidales bacterium]
MFFQRFLLSIFFILIALCSQGQVIDTINSSPKDTISNIDVQKKEISEIEKKHSPLKASLYSAVVPGLGQIYNRQAWKVPVIYVAEGALLYLAVTNYNGAQKFKDEYLLRSNNIQAGRNPNYSNYPDESIYNLYYAYEKNFELSIVAGALVYILNIVDAMVYAHLFDFDISPNLSMNLTPYYLPSVLSPNSGPSLGFSMRFNLK